MKIPYKSQDKHDNFAILLTSQFIKHQLCNECNSLVKTHHNTIEEF